MNNTIKIRAAVKEDLPTLREFEQAIISVERPFNDNLKQDKICYYDLGALIAADTSIVMVAESKGKIVASGYARIKQSKAHLNHEHHAYLGCMYVAPDHRGQGLNQGIIQALITWGKARQMKDFYLEAYTENSSAIRAYEKMGFSQSLVEMKLSI